MNRALVMACLLTSAFTSMAAVDGVDPAVDEFHFVVLGDAQFDNPAAFNRSIDQIRLMRPAFVVQVGDLIDGYVNDLEQVGDEWQRFRRQIAPLAPVAYFAVPGNHDVYNADVEVDPALEALFESQWGDLYYRFTYKNAEFVVINSDSSRLANGVDDEQLAWLDAVLAKSETDHTFVFLHKPPFTLVNGDVLHQLFVAHGVDWVIYGHHHHQHFELRDGVRYVMTNNSGTNPVPFDELGAFQHWLFVSVRDAEVSISSIEVDSVRPIDFVTIDDNYGYFLLQRAMPRDVKATTKGDRYEINLPLPNPSGEELNAFVSCSSADARWQFEPLAIPVQRLRPGSNDGLSIDTWTHPGRRAESSPVCRVEVPYQTSAGRWLRFERDVRITIPGS